MVWYDALGLLCEVNMKIEHEVQDVSVVRYRTAREAISSIPGPHQITERATNIFRRLSGAKLEQNDTLTVLDEPLWKEYEGDTVYVRTCARVVLERLMTRVELVRELAGLGYYPASLSESVACVVRLKESGVQMEDIFCLGAVFLTKQYEEMRLLLKKGGDVELVRYFPETRLRPSIRIVAVKEIKRKRT